MKRILITLMLGGTCALCLSAAHKVDFPQTFVQAVGATPAAQSSTGVHKAFKEQFIEGHLGIMSSIAIAFVMGLGFSFERLAYLGLSHVRVGKLMERIEDVLERGDLEAAKGICRSTRGPAASVCYQGLMRAEDDLDVVERSMKAFGRVQMGYLQRGCLWIRLAIGLTFGLGVLGAFVNLFQAFDGMGNSASISSLQLVAALKVALIPLIFGCISSLLLKVLLCGVQTLIDALRMEMEESAISLMDLLVTYCLKYAK